MQAKISRMGGGWHMHRMNQAGEVYVRPFPEADTGKWQISTSGGTSPLWSPDGRGIVLSQHDNSVMAVAVETTSAPALGP